MQIHENHLFDNIILCDMANHLSEEKNVCLHFSSKMVNISLTYKARELFFISF